MSKTSTKESSNQIDQNLANETQALMSLARKLASLGDQRYKGVSIAAHTPQQTAAMAAPSQAAAAFGMDAPGVTAPSRAEQGAYGIMGYSPETAMKQSGHPVGQTVNALKSFFKQAGTELPKVPTFQDSGGKK